jgi:hypothetical protein
MLPLLTPWRKIAAAAAIGTLCLTLRSDVVPSKGPGLSARIMCLPRRTLWAWERPEDLHFIDPATTAIASLDQTIVVGKAVVSQPRRQPLSYPSAVRRIAVVRIEVVTGATLDTAQQHEIANLLLQSASQSDIAAFQVDFDARRSQRGFYSRLLRDLRQRMPAGLPLSITALASWCTYDDWIGGLPVDEAVPMFFRMEPDRRRAFADSPQFRIREPKCMSSAGISTREAWPDDLADKRIYVFADRGWREDFALLAGRKLP